MSKVSEAVDNRTDSPSQPPGDTPPRRSPLRMAGLAFLRQREATVLVGGLEPGDPVDRGREQHPMSVLGGGNAEPLLHAE